MDRIQSESYSAREEPVKSNQQGKGKPRATNAKVTKKSLTKHEQTEPRNMKQQHTNNPTVK